ncbi:MAG: N-acetyltransferase [Clostridia bacterium]|nr:N-acetyltransferase [Clostridia bacterium]
MIFRPARPDDAAAMAAIHLPYVRDTAVTFQYELPDEQFFLRKMQALAAFPFLVCEEGGQVRGFAYASALRSKEAYQWDAETTVYLDPACCGQGAGSGLYARLLALLKAQGYQAAYACVTAPNPASFALHRRFGFAEVGRFPAAGYKLGAWHDVVWLRLPLAEHPLSPAPPVAFGALPTDTVNHILAKGDAL